MRSTRPLTRLLNVCMYSIWFLLLLYDSFYPVIVCDCGMQIIAQIQVIFFFSYDKHYLISHIFLQMCHSIILFMEYQVVYLSIHHLYFMVLMSMMILLEVYLMANFNM